ncbi:MAG: glycosyltransferase, partial [Bacteroidota bacterium]
IDIAHLDFEGIFWSNSDEIANNGLDDEKIHVVYNGSNAGFHPIPPSRQQAVRDQYSQGKPYFYFVGTIQPRKNLETLLRAFDLFKSKTDSPVQLVLVGRKGWKYGAAMEAYENMQHKDAVHFTGFVPDEALNDINSASLGLVYVPHFEGFGIPMLEAMHSETAIIAACNTSLPEVVGDAALMVNSRNAEEIAAAILRLWQEPETRQDLIQAGRKQREQFSWDRAAEEVWEVLSSQI